LLFVAQPALGLQIRQLEEELGMALLLRHSRGVAPTPAGQLLYDGARDLLQRAEALKAQVKGLDASAAETLILGLSPSVSVLLGQDIMLEARGRLPNVFLSLFEAMSIGLIEAMDRQEVDVAFAYDYSDRPSLSGTPLFDEELLFVSAPGGDPEQPIALAEALARDLVLASERDPIRRTVEARAQKLGIRPHIVFEAQSVALMKSVVAAGHAATIMPYGIATEELRRGELVGRRIEQPLLRRLYLVKQSQRVPLRAEAEIDAFLGEMAQRLRLALGPLAHAFTA
jgi:LysR family nitrogen assimilation transcriptional regulator